MKVSAVSHFMSLPTGQTVTSGLLVKVELFILKRENLKVQKQRQTLTRQYSTS